MRNFAVVTLGIFIGLLAGWHISQIYLPAHPEFRLDTKIDLPFTSRSTAPSATSKEPVLPRITEPQTVEAMVTGYDPYDPICVEQYANVWPRKTATGTDAEKPGVAADPSVIPYGSTVEIEGIPGRFMVDDTGKTMRDASRNSSNPLYWIDVRIPAPYREFSDPDEARKEAHARAAQLGGHMRRVTIIPPDQQALLSPAE